MTNFAANSLILLAQAADEPFRPKVPESDAFWTPVGASNFASEVDWLYTFILGVSIAVVVLVVVTMTFFAIRFRAKSRKENEQATSKVSHNTPLEIAWSIPPLVIFVPIFLWGFGGYVDMRQAPKDAIEIQATAQKWQWSFKYSNGGKSDKLFVPIGRDVRIVIQAKDVLHSLSIPSFRVKMDAVPGRYTDLWFRPTKTGKYPIFCTEYCGTNHSEMLSEATVFGSYAEWQKKIKELIKRGPPLKEGEKIYNTAGCKTCHSLDGTPKVGPTWKGLFGSKRTLADGSTVTADENYIKQSILEPNSQVVQGFAPSMPTFQGQLDDRDIDDVITFIKSQK